MQRLEITRRAMGALGLAMLSAAAQAGQAPSPGRPTPAGRASRSREVADLRHFAEATHPNGTVAANDPQWRGLADRLQASADRLTPERYLIEVLRLLSWFRDGHTGVNIFAFAQGAFGLRLPLMARPFSDGAYVIAADGEAAPLLGAKLTRINGMPVSRIMGLAEQFWPRDNQAWLQRWSTFLLTNPGLLSGMDVARGSPDSAIIFEGETGDGLAVRAAVRAQPVAGGAGAAMHQMHEAGERNTVRSLGAGRIALINLTDMGDVEGKPFAEFRREIFAAIDDSRTERLIFDVRRNGGGNNFIGDRIRRHAQLSRLNRPGGLYVLIGPQTFSAGQNFVTRMERETFAIFVGQPTGGRPNHFGDPESFAGAQSGIMVRVSKLRWQDMPPLDERIWTMPDIVTPDLIADHVAQRDPALDAALSHAPDPAVDERVLLQPWARASQLQSWRPFWAA